MAFVSNILKYIKWKLILDQKKKQPMHHPLIEPLIQYKNSIITFCLIFYKYMVMVLMSKILK